MTRCFLAVSLIAMSLAGCVSKSSVTNLTPTQYPRNDTGVYTLEVELLTAQQTVRHHSIAPKIVVGLDTYPMRRTLKTENRWEGTVPVPRGKSQLNYHYKFDYEYNRFGPPGRDSKLSPEYELKIVER